MLFFLVIMNMVHNIENNTNLQNWIAKGSSILFSHVYHVEGYDNFHTSLIYFKWKHISPLFFLFFLFLRNNNSVLIFDPLCLTFHALFFCSARDTIVLTLRLFIKQV